MKNHSWRKSHFKGKLSGTGFAWEVEEDLYLTELFEKGYCVNSISQLHGRTSSSIAARLVRLSLIEKRSDFYVRRRARL